MSRIFLYTIIISFILIKKSFAYLDPGTASIVFQAIIGAIATASITIGIYWKKFSDLCKKIINMFSSTKKKIK